MMFPVPNQFRDGYLDVSFCQLAIASRNRLSRERLIRKITQAYDLSRTERALIRDAVHYTLDYFHLGIKSEAAKPADAGMLRNYGRTLCRILQESFGEDRQRGFPARFYVGKSPMVVLEVSLSPTRRQPKLDICRVAERLSEALRTVDRLLLEKQSSGVYVRRDVHVYEKDRLYVAKRNQRRLWTESAAMREADEIYAEIMRAWGREAWG